MLKASIRSRQFDRITSPVYHGTLSHNYFSLLKGVDINAGRRNLDFGKGFYLTTDFRQASEIAKRKADNLGADPIVFVYNLDRTRLRNDFKGQIFTRMNEKWSDFIYMNRSSLFDMGSQYDYVFGGVADGTDLFALIDEINMHYKNSGEIKSSYFLHNIAKYMYDQLVICNSDIIKHGVLKLDKVVIAYDQNEEYVPKP
ncbi:DUF3990 domain-containing protein [Paenibacillus sp. SGZ-1009]|uniref:DUF3990 domain-containing protein n=1 Tax=Paenibacillus campi TaxID=3106031 RepID=UPI002AFF65A1|nr:DUF3990 domain-containing protein [Paenibacillus sp. SGZ-1009]